jgi:hypothetical protein
MKNVEASDTEQKHRKEKRYGSNDSAALVSGRIHGCREFSAAT